MAKQKKSMKFEEPCSWCDGTFHLSMKTVEGYPVIECDSCNAFGFLPVDGKEKPFRFYKRRLHEVGCELGFDFPAN